jgi:hypothetical protein
MTLPTNTILPSDLPSLRNCASASRDGVGGRSANLSVTRRLISSGIVRSKLHSPASTCAIRVPSFAAKSAAAVEFTSP